MAKDKIKIKLGDTVVRSGNGRARLQSDGQKWAEIGSPGLEIFGGFVSEAYHADLEWPTVYPLFNRIRRSDPEISIVRQLFVALARRLKFVWVPDSADPNEDDQKAVDFGAEIFGDLEGGETGLMETIVSYAPFMGWAWWEVVPGLRRDGWKPPGDDPWRSRYNDGRLGIRRLAWRDHSSFARWEIDEFTGRLHGMWQKDHPNDEVLIPKDQSVLLTFGDTVNPEGLSPLEAVWRLERIKYGLEFVQGVGYEHAAGYLEVKSEKEKLTAADHTAIKKVARAILSAKEGNYAAWPKGFTGEVKDTTFSAASSILEAVKYYGILKLQLFMMQWIALSATSGTGSFAAKKEDTTMFVLYFNSMMEGFARQLGEQLAPWIFDRNKEAFPGLERNPRLTVTPLEKMVQLDELTPWVSMLLEKGFPLDDADFLWFRERAGMPEALPEDEEVEEVPDSSSNTEESDEQNAEDMIEEGDVRGAMSQFQLWAEDRAPWINRLLKKKVKVDHQSISVPTELSLPGGNEMSSSKVSKLIDRMLDTMQTLAKSKGGSEGVHLHLPDSLTGEFEVPAPNIKIDVHVPEQKPPIIEVKVPSAQAPKVEVNVPSQGLVMPKIEVKIPKQDAPKIEIINKMDFPKKQTETITIERGRGNLITRIKKVIGFK